MNRNHYLLLGLIILYLGLQCRFVESFVLNERASRFLASRSEETKAITPGVNLAAAKTVFTVAAVGAPLKTVTPPKWIGWALISIGSVLILHSLAMSKPGG